ncbi:MAG: Asd/ArgC dimerization domain-containing protein [Thermoanaerobaculia bacterium]|nr:Asd/ArgC dimerization domain-containing protein [Thermoanaerobaculia bacterium]
MSRREDAVGSLTDVAGAAAMVTRLEPASLDEIDLLILCDPVAEDAELLAGAPPSMAAIVVAPTTALPDLATVVVGSRSAEAGARRVISPHPAAIALSHLLEPLRGLGLVAAAATLLQPASVFDDSALDEIYDQTRSLLAFRQIEPGRHFARQIAFNLSLAPESEAAIESQLAELLGDGVELSFQLVQAPVFHGFSISLFLRLAPETRLEDVEDALAAGSFLVAADADRPATPVAVTSSQEIVVERVRRATGARGLFSLWAVFDNLTRGGASNAVGLARSILAAGRGS